MVGHILGVLLIGAGGQQDASDQAMQLFLGLGNHVIAPVVSGS